MSTRNLLFLLLLAFSFKVSLSNDISNDIDTTSSKYLLWKELEKDTLPYHVSHENIAKQAESSFLRLIAANGIDTTGIRNLYLRAYYDNLLAKNDQLLDFFEQNIQEYPAFQSELLGHFGLRRILSCYNNPSDSCQSIVKWGVSFLEKAAQSSTVMPKEQWEWMYKRFQQQLPYSTFDQKIKIHSTPDLLNQKNWEGAIIQFNRTPTSQNLLVSDGSRFPLQILEWDAVLSQWMDVTASTKLDSFPGGYRLYAGDINLDGYDDLIILRSASTRMSPAKLFPSVLINQKDGTFKDIALDLELQKLVKPQCACAGDINNDGLMDLYFGNLRDQSLFLIQNPDGTYTDKRNAYGMDDFKDNIQDCMFFDYNNDGHLDLLLSGYHNENKIYIQSFTNTLRRYFDHKIENYQIKAPQYGGAILSTSKNNEQSVLFLSDVSERYDILPNIFTKKDSIQKDTSFHIYHEGKNIKNELLPKELSVYRTGVIINTIDEPILLYSGGKNTETILPYFEYKLGDKHVQVAYNEQLPIYAHSTTVIEIEKQPVIIFRGGGDYPAMQSGTTLISYHPDTSGSYHKIFDIQNEKIGNKISYIVEDMSGQQYSKQITVQLRDSKGNNAMQEWVWLPEGYKIVTSNKNVNTEDRKSKKKKNKKNKL